jgi:hypothetical protein
MRFFLFIATALLLSWTAVEAVSCDTGENMTTRVNPLYYECCAKSRQYKNGDSYHENLKSLVDKLLRNISTSEANYFASDRVDSVYGFVLCRGDSTGTACARRVNQTIQDAIVNRFICPFYKDVAIYYDQHTVSFSGDEFLYGDRSNRPAWVASNMNFVKGSTGAAARYSDRIQELMKAMSERTAAAWNSSTTKLYATGMSWFGEEDVRVLHGMVQCRSDLDKDLCRKCLGDIITKIPEKFVVASDGDHRVGGRILGVWCSLRFEKDLFFKITPETIKLHEPKKGLNKLVIIVSSIAAGLLAVILISGLVLFIKRKRGEYHT